MSLTNLTSFAVAMAFTVYWRERLLSIELLLPLISGYGGEVTGKVFRPSLMELSSVQSELQSML